MRKKGYLIPVVTMYLFGILASIVFILLSVQNYKVKKYGIPVQCEVLSVKEKSKSEQNPETGETYTVYEYETCVKYCIDGKEYTDTVSGDKGEKGDIVELLYLQEEPEKVYGKVYDETIDIMNKIIVGWFGFWIIYTILLVSIFRRGRLVTTDYMAERMTSQEERIYIGKAYDTSSVFGIYLFNLFIMVFIGTVVAMFIASRNETDLAAQRFHEMFPALLAVCAGFLILFIRGVRILHNKRAIKKGNFTIIEGMAEKYIPYKISGGGSSLPSDNGTYMARETVTFRNGKIIFRANNGRKESDWITLKYRSCPKGSNLGEFPVLLIILPNGKKFAVTDWDRIRNNPQYAHIKPFMIL